MEWNSCAGAGNAFSATCLSKTNSHLRWALPGPVLACFWLFRSRCWAFSMMSRISYSSSGTSRYCCWAAWSSWTFFFRYWICSSCVRSHSSTDRWICSSVCWICDSRVLSSAFSRLFSSSSSSRRLRVSASPSSACPTYNWTCFTVVSYSVW